MEKIDALSSSEERDNRGRFAKGHKKRGGRTHGTRNELTMVFETLAALGDREAMRAYVKRIAEEKPTLMVKLLAKILRKETEAQYRAELRAGLWPPGEPRRGDRRLPELSGMDPRAEYERD